MLKLKKKIHNMKIYYVFFVQISYLKIHNNNVNFVHIFLKYQIKIELL